jgi:hypothetical protein
MIRIIKLSILSLLALSVISPASSSDKTNEKYADLSPILQPILDEKISTEEAFQQVLKSAKDLAFLPFEAKSLEDILMLFAGDFFMNQNTESLETDEITEEGSGPFMLNQVIDKKLQDNSFEALINRNKASMYSQLRKIKYGESKSVTFPTNVRDSYIKSKKDDEEIKKQKEEENRINTYIFESAKFLMNPESDLRNLLSLLIDAGKSNLQLKEVFIGRISAVNNSLAQLFKTNAEKIKCLNNLKYTIIEKSEELKNILESEIQSKPEDLEEIHQFYQQAFGAIFKSFSSLEISEEAFEIIKVFVEVFILHYNSEKLPSYYNSKLLLTLMETGDLSKLQPDEHVAYKMLVPSFIVYSGKNVSSSIKENIVKNFETWGNFKIDQIVWLNFVNRYLASISFDVSKESEGLTYTFLVSLANFLSTTELAKLNDKNFYKSFDEFMENTSISEDQEKVNWTAIIRLLNLYNNRGDMKNITLNYPKLPGEAFVEELSKGCDTNLLNSFKNIMKNEKIAKSNALVSEYNDLTSKPLYADSVESNNAKSLHSKITELQVEIQKEVRDEDAIRAIAELIRTGHRFNSPKYKLVI